MIRPNAIEIFSTCPASNAVARARYLGVVADVAAWSERAGCAGVLVLSGREYVDPWLLTQLIVQQTSALLPLVTVHAGDVSAPAVTKQVASFAFLHGRRIALNLVAEDGEGDALVAFVSDIDRRIGPSLNHKHAPRIPKSLAPRWFVSAGDARGFEAALNARVTPIRNAAAAGPSTPSAAPCHAVRVGVIARDRADHAWTIARSRFPCDRRETNEDERYWLAPMREYHATCPYLVGSYDAIAQELSRYVERGCRTLILDTPTHPDDLEHAMAAIGRALTPAAA